MIIKNFKFHKIDSDVSNTEEEKKIQASFIASTSAVDRYGDIIDQNGWMLDNYRSNPIILFNHDATQLSIGRGDVEVIDGNLMIDITFDTKDPRAAEIGRKVKDGFLNAVSVGFNAMEQVHRDELPADHFAYGQKGMYFPKAELLEVSIVTIPANQEAVSSKEYKQEDEAQEEAQEMMISQEQAKKLLVFVDELKAASRMHAFQARYIEDMLGVDKGYHDEDSEEDTEEEKSLTKADENYGLKSNAKEAMEALSEATQTALRNKAKEHNEEYGDDPEKKITNVNYLAVSYHRGLAAFNTNPESVRPNVGSSSQWAMARVNGLLFAIRTGKFKDKPFDVDLLPKEHPLSNEQEDKSITKEVTDFPKAGDDLKVSLRNTEYDLFPLDYADDIKENYPQIWNKGGNILGNQQFNLLRRIQENNGVPETDNQEEAIRLREAWAARHLKDFRLAGTVAQMKWLVIGEKGLQHMKDLMNEEKEKYKVGSKPKEEEEKSFSDFLNVIINQDKI